jgi:hypothetical protein
MANWREELLFEKGPFDEPPSVLKRKMDASAKKDAREAKAEGAAERSADYRQYQKDTLEYKKGRLKWQQERSLKKDKERRNRENESRITGPLKDIKTQTISSKDPDSTAGAKLVGNAASLVGGVAKAGAAAVVHNIKKRKEAKRKKQIEAGTQKAQEKDAEMEASRKQPRLPPAGRTLGQKARANKSIRQKEISNRMPKKQYDFKQSEYDKGNPRTPPTAAKRPKRPVRPSIGNATGPASNPKRPTNEEYSCWREEFLCELGDIRRGKMKKDKNDRTVNVMSGTNKITLFPTITEEVDNEGGMSRNELSTIERAIKSLRKKIKSNEQQLPAWVQSKISKASDYIDSVADYMMGETEPVNESHDDETFRQHSQGTLDTTSTSFDNTRRRRTSTLLAKMREMGMQTEPKKKKKSKKKRVIDEAGPVLSVGRGEKLSVERGGGLTAKGRAKYNRATGSNLQAPVTGKVNPGSKAAKRRKNFCSRSRSWDGERGLAARRRWKC